MVLKTHPERFNEWMTVLFFGLLSAIAATFHFNIPGLENGITDPREMIALTSVFFLRDWKSALAVGFIASFGGPYNDSFFNTVLMHIVAIPAAWFIYQMDRRRVKSQLNIVILWAFQVIGLYIFVYLFLFAFGLWIFGKSPDRDFWMLYATVFSGVKIEMVATSVITALILALRLTRLELSKEGKMLNLFVESREFGVWEWDIESDKLSLSRHWLEKMELPNPNQGISMQQYMDAIHPEDKASFAEKIELLVKGEIKVMHNEYRIKIGKKNYFWVYNSAQRMDNEIFSADVKKIVGVVIDISERKQAEEKNEKLQQQLIQAQKMESIGTLAGGIAHDFNNLLTVINGHAEMAALRLDKPDIVQKDLLAIQSAGEKAVRLTGQLLAFSRRQIYEPRRVNLNSIVRDMQKMLVRIIGEDIHIEVNLTDTELIIQADPVQIEQIMLNLIVNARDAIHESVEKAGEKKITIETSQSDLKATYLDIDNKEHSGEFVVLSVSDNGKGMDKETIKKIFDPFFTTKDKSRGTGLGLSMVYGIVEQNKGHISVYSEPEIGTTFKIYWPKAEKGIEPEKEESVEVTRLSGNETILYVEDDQQVREFTVNVLSSFGYTVHHTHSGKEALHWVADNKLKPDLLITDLIMPDMNGRELAEKIEKILPECPILYNSGYTDNHIVHNGSLNKGVNFLHKPFSTRELLEKVRKILDE